MPAPLPIVSITVHHLAIPMRHVFAHAAAARAMAEPLVVALELANHVVGYGETHPRAYVSGESVESVERTIREVFVPRLVEMRPANFGDAIEAAGALPAQNETGTDITAARAAVELALLDAYSRAFNRTLATLAGWFEQPWLGVPGSAEAVRFSGVIGASPPERVRRTLWKMRLGHLRDFKLKVGDADDDARLGAAIDALGRHLQTGKVTLRLDANGAWSADEAADRLARWASHPVASVEQPLARDAPPSAWASLAQRSPFPLMADESLVSEIDAHRLIEQGARPGFNIRISKNGGLIPAMRLAILARRFEVPVQLGCMVGETSILSAAGRWFLQMVPEVRFAEGSFGRFLLADDVVTRPLRFGFGGRWRPMEGPGLGVAVEESALSRLASQPATRLPL